MTVCDTRTDGLSQPTHLTETSGGGLRDSCNHTPRGVSHPWENLVSCYSWATTSAQAPCCVFGVFPRLTYCNEAPISSRTSCMSSHNKMIHHTHKQKRHSRRISRNTHRKKGTSPAAATFEDNFLCLHYSLFRGCMNSQMWLRWVIWFTHKQDLQQGVRFYFWNANNGTACVQTLHFSLFLHIVRILSLLVNSDMKGSST